KGVRGRGLTFDGDDDYLVGDDTYLPYGDSNITLSLWINPAEVQHDKGVLGYGTYGSNNLFNVYLYNTSLGERLIGLLTLENEIENIFSNTKYVANEWQHIVFSYNGTHVSSYVNGDIKDNPELVLNISNHGESPFRIGWAHIGYRFNGSLDEVMIFNRSLSESEILALYNSQLNSLSATISNLQDGLHNYKVYAIDEAGNYNSSGKRNFIVDTKLYCGELNSANKVYTLTSNVSSQGTCFTITQPNITLDCAGYWINYSINGSNNTYGIYSNQFNTTIKNCNIVEGNFSNPVNNKHGIYFYEAGNSTIFNNYINIQSSHPIDVRHSSIYINITKNTVISNSGPVVYLAGSKNSIIENNTVIANGSAGLYLLSSSDNCTLINNNVSNIGEGGDGVYIVNSNDVFVINNTVTGKYARAVNLYRSLNTVVLNQVAYGGDDGLEIWGSNNSIIKDCINLSGNVDDVFISSLYGLSVNNTFINCSYNLNKETVDGTENELIRKWYYQAYVNNTEGSPLSNANISAYNTTGQLQFTTLTNPSGYIPRQEITEYVNTGGTRNYQTPHTVNVTKSGYSTNSTSYNLTILQNVFANIILGETSCECPGLNINWELDMSEYCNVTTNCDLGTGNMTFINVGETRFNATVSTLNMEYPITGQTIFMQSGGLIKVG
ncbi:MAG TPA: right-handed parallel beta-helix repeat-containing protein, partial [Candidatus Pacearchaeota archaeon]|nr:right-handed parallel beta-helix repeat-containing protein [Candidatus Pacearchaeota archaeon]